jgi:hypothetical protein
VTSLRQIAKTISELHGLEHVLKQREDQRSKEAQQKLAKLIELL